MGQVPGNIRNYLSLSRKLLVSVLVTSTIATTMTSLFQIGMEYQFAKKNQFSEIQVFESSAISGMQNSFWNYNEQALNDQLSSSITNLDFIEITVFDDHQKVVAKKSKKVDARHIETKTFVLKNPHNTAESIGSVELTITNDVILQELWRKSLWIIVANFLKTLIVSTILINLFNRYMVSRLSFLAKQISDPTWRESATLQVQPQRWPFQKRDDEISDIENALIAASDAIRGHNLTLKNSAMSSARLAELGIFANGISHEINNPLAIISGTMQSFERHARSGNIDPEVMKSAATRTLNAATRISKIISGLSSLSRDGDSDPIETVEIRVLLEDTLNLCEATLARRGIAFTSTIEPENLRLSCRTVQMSQILLNLINNSSDAIHDLNEKWIRIHFFQQADGNHIVCTITDSGGGIPNAVQEKIFVPFFTTKDVGKGTGLGLAIVHSMVEQHGGSILINNKSPNTQFVIKFPIKELQNVA